MFRTLFGRKSRSYNSNRVSSQDEEFSSRRVSSSSLLRRNSELEGINSKNYDDNESDDGNDYDNDKDYDKKYNNSSYLIFRNYWKKRLPFLSNENCKSSIKWLLDSAYFELRISYDDILLLLTIFVLIAPSIAILVVPKSGEYAFAIAMTICFSVFIAEFVLSSYSKTQFSWIKHESIIEYNSFTRSISYWTITWQGYFGSPIWFLDIIIIVSLFPDVPAIASSLDLSQVGTGIMAARFIRMFRVLRALKAVILLHQKRAQDNARLQLHEQFLQNIDNSTLNMQDELRALEKKITRPSRLGEQLGTAVITKVVTLIVVMLLVIPFLEYHPKNYVTTYSADMLQAINIQSSLTNEVKNAMVNIAINKLQELHVPSIYLSMHPLSANAIVNDANALNNLLPVAIVTESESYTNQASGILYSTYAEYSIDYYLRLQSVYSLSLIIIVVVLTLLATYVFTQDINNLVLKPIMRMMKVVEVVAKNPLANVKFNTHKNLFGSFETDLLEKTFIKIAGLLRVGFGEAGAGIIKANLAVGDDNSAIINPLLPGVRVYCIVGFCDIHRFDFAMRRLGQDVLVFVNTVAAIVHENVHSWEGVCNKNLGNAFVLIWRIGDESTLKSFNILAKAQSQTSISLSHRMTSKSALNNRSLSVKTSSASKTLGGENKAKYQRLDLKRLPGVDQLAAKALIGFLKIIAQLNINDDVYKYHLNPKLQTGGKNFDLHMGFGLHAGWAIEGAVGSLQKVDATYLSPHVNMAARLETASRQYGVPLLVSQDFYELLSPYVHTFMRRLDVVTVKGSENPMGIYTYDTMSICHTGGGGNTRRQRRRGSVAGNRRASRSSSVNEDDSHAPVIRSSLIKRMTSMSNWNLKASRASTVADNVHSSPYDTTAGVTPVTPFSPNSECMTPTPVHHKHGNDTDRSDLQLSSVKSIDTSDGNTDSSAAAALLSPASKFPSTLKTSEAVMTTRTNSMIKSALSQKDLRKPNERKLSFADNTSSSAAAAASTVAESAVAASSAETETLGSEEAPFAPFKRSKTEKNLNNIMNSKDDPDDVFERDRDVVYLRSHVTTEFLDEFAKGMRKYLSGDWIEAKSYFEKCDLAMRNNPGLMDSQGDGPSQTLLKYMKSFDFKAPANWQGYRPLTSK